MKPVDRHTKSMRPGLSLERCEDVRRARVRNTRCVQHLAERLAPATWRVLQLAAMHQDIDIIGDCEGISPDAVATHVCAAWAFMHEFIASADRPLREEMLAVLQSYCRTAAFLTVIPERELNALAQSGLKHSLQAWFEQMETPAPGSSF